MYILLWQYFVSCIIGFVGTIHFNSYTFSFTTVDKINFDSYSFDFTAVDKPLFDSYSFSFTTVDKHS